MCTKTNLKYEEHECEKCVMFFTKNHYVILIRDLNIDILFGECLLHHRISLLLLLNEDFCKKLRRNKL